MEGKYISVSEYAKFVGLTSQHVYNLLNSGKLVGYEFVRGRMKGWLIEKPVGYDTWKEQEGKK